MKILQLIVNDIKRISAVEINPENGEPVILTGDNGNGKSSVLDAILLALDNSGLDDPIRHGRPSGTVKIKLGQDKEEYIVERKITKKDSYLTLTTANGIPVQKPQTFLNGLVGNYAFDPLLFVRLKPKEQVEALKQAAGLDFTEIDAKRAEFYAERTRVGRDGKEAAGLLASLTLPEGEIPAEELSAAELVEKLRGLEELARNVTVKAAAMNRAEEEQKQADAKVARLKEELLKAEQEAYGAGIVFDDCRKEYLRAEGMAPSPVDIEVARDAIEQIDETNRKVREARAYREADARVTKLRADYETLSRRIEEVDLAKAEAVKEANLPIDGMELTDEGVMMGGTFFSQLSTAEQIRISALVAMSQNPDLKIILIREGALMNKANLQMLADMAREKDYQLWIEKFQEDPSDEGLHIVDGSITHKDGEPV